MPLHSTTASPAAIVACRVAFGARTSALSASEAATLSVALPVLAGPAEEFLLTDAQALETRAGFSLFHRADQVAGYAIAAPELSLEEAAADLYRRLFAATGGLHLQRIWNYVPDINAVPGGLENYQHFCRGRSLAFERHFGRDFEQRLPAASGVGAKHGPLALAFLAGENAPRHFENPQQVPAFHYPLEYGPRSPSFSRATLVHDPAGRKQLFISGTAAIRGHATVAPNHLAGQLACTVENLNIIGAISGAGPDVGRSQAWSRHFKVYLRHASDLAATREHLEGSLLGPGDQVSFLQAELCRADLLVEIEASLSK